MADHNRTCSTDLQNWEVEMQRYWLGMPALVAACALALPAAAKDDVPGVSDTEIKLAIIAAVKFDDACSKYFSTDHARDFWQRCVDAVARAAPVRPPATVAAINSASAAAASRFQPERPARTIKLVLATSGATPPAGAVRREPTAA